MVFCCDIPATSVVASHENRLEKSAGNFKILQKLLTKQLFLFQFPSRTSLKVNSVPQYPQTSQTTKLFLRPLPHYILAVKMNLRLPITAFQYCPKDDTESVLNHSNSNNSPCILLHKALSPASFGRYQNQPIGSPY